MSCLMRRIYHIVTYWSYARGSVLISLVEAKPVLREQPFTRTESQQEKTWQEYVCNESIKGLVHDPSKQLCLTIHSK